MAEGTRYYLDALELEYAEFELSWTTGPASPEITITQPVDLADELDALPRVCAFSMHSAIEDNTANPTHGDHVFPNWRIKDVVRRDTVCRVVLADVRDDLAKKVCPADFLMRWKDGFLDGTNHPTLQLAVEYLGGLIPLLAQELDADAFVQVAGSDVLPNELPTAGGMLNDQLEALAALVGATLAVRPSTGKLFFAKLGTAADISFPVAAYNWDGGFEPSWTTTNRKQRGLPQVIRVPYRELHAIRLIGGNDRETSSYPPELQMEMVQVYAHGDSFLTLRELLAAFNLPPGAISDSQIGRVINTDNFDGTALEPLGGFDTDAKALINIIKQDWRTLWRVEFPNQVGRRGGWVNLRFGYFKQTPDKDGNLYFSGDITGRGVRCEWSEWLARAEEQSDGEQASIVGAVVARSHQRGGGNSPLPDAPFSAAWVSEKDHVFRVSPGNVPSSAQHVWLGRMTQRELTITDIGLSVDDQGVTTGTTGGLGFPTLADVKFSSTFTIEVFVVAERRLPNNEGRWTIYEVPAFADGEVESQDLEVGDHLFVLRDYISPNERKFAESDGLGTQLENLEPETDSQNRARVVVERLSAPFVDDATAIGAEAAFDLAPGRGIKAITLDVDGCYVTTVIQPGGFDSEEARQRRATRRDQGRMVEYGGKVAAL